MKKFLLILIAVLAISSTAVAQKAVSGVVQTGTGEPLPYASIMVKGFNKAGVLSDQNGRYKITIPANGTTLVVSSLGMETKEVQIGNNDVINIILEESSLILDKVVVTAMGVQRQSKEIGYSVTKVTSKEIDIVKPTDIGQALAAKVSGMMVNVLSPDIAIDGRKDDPTTKIYLRGQRSFNTYAKNQPMLVVDGVETPLSFMSSINVADIENISVMKGASGAALYGSSAVNGVIYLTTKTGKTGRPQISYSYTMTLANLAYLPDMQKDYGGGYSLDPVTGFPVYNKTEYRQWGPKYTGEMVDWGNPIFDANNPSGYQQKIKYAYVPGGRESFFRTGVDQQHNFSYSAGNDNSRVYFSMQAVTQKGLTPQEEGSRFNFRLNASNSFNRLKISGSMMYNIGGSNVDGFTASPMDLMTGYPGNIRLSDYKDWKNERGATPDDWYTTASGKEPPYYKTAILRQEITNNRFLGGIDLNYKIINGLQLVAKGGISTWSSNTLYKQYAYHFSDWAKNSMGKTYSRNDIKSSIYEYKPTSRTLNLDLFLDYNKEIKEFSLKAKLGASVSEKYNNNIQIGGTDLKFDDIFNVLHSGKPVTASHEYFLTRTSSVFSSLSLGYKNYAFVEVTGRNDWTSVLDPQNWSYFYPGANASFIVSEMLPQLKKNDIISYLKIRGSWAKVGSVGVGPYSLNNTFSTSQGFPFQDGVLGGYSMSTLNNRFIEPEFTTDREIAMELGLLDERISLETVLYWQTCVNQTISLGISGASGFGSTRKNIGKMTSNGVEIDLKLTPLLKLGEFRLNTKLNYTYVDNRVRELYGNEKSFSVMFPNFAVVGERYPAMKAFSDYLRDPEGRIIVDAQTGRPSISWGFTDAILGTPVAPHRFGLIVNAFWKGVSFNCVADYRTGHIYQHNSATSLLSSGASSLTTIAGRERFVMPNSVIAKVVDGKTVYEPNENVTFMNGQEFFTNYISYGVYTTSAASVKIREISLSYDIPEKLLKKTKLLQKASIGVFGRNLFAFYPKTNIYGDTEFGGSSTGNDGAAYNNSPNYRTYGFNVNIGF